MADEIKLAHVPVDWRELVRLRAEAQGVTVDQVVRHGVRFDFKAAAAEAKHQADEVKRRADEKQHKADSLKELKEIVKALKKK